MTTLRRNSAYDPSHLLVFVVLSLGFLYVGFACRILHGVDVRAQVCADLLHIEETQRQGLYLRLLLGH